jgi:Na+/H+ antiporter NhaD/arsenite permease-like protein
VIDPISNPWPFNRSLIFAALALLTAIVSMMFENWTGTVLMVGSIVLDVLAAVSFYRAWAIQPKHSRYAAGHW